MTSKEKWTIYQGSAADIYGPRAYRHWEDGFIYNEWPTGHVVVLTNDYGEEYHHPHRFDSPESAQRFVDIVQRHLDKGKQPNLDVWQFSRVRYGTRAYLDEEPMIVWREKQDAIQGMDEVFLPIGGHRHDDLF